MKQFLIIVFCIVSGLSYSQTYSINGRVADSNTKKGIPYATIVVKSKIDHKILYYPPNPNFPL